MPLPRCTSALAVVVALVTLAESACGSDRAAGGSAGDTVSGSINVFAAASLTGAYTAIGKAFETAHPHTTVQFNFDASSTLVTQIDQGAPADVFAAADQPNMTKLVDAGGASGAPRVFATNSLQIIVEHGNPKHIATLADLEQPGLIYVACAPEVPIGTYAQQVLDEAHVTLTPASLEQNVKGIVSKVTAGEADAGIVYRTDVTAAGADASGVDIPTDVNITASYPVVVTKHAANPTTATEFVDFVLGPAGQQILRSYGFTAP